ncbi:substrate-binding periplasmic protein [Roseateles albus]|uniref:Transporter substrate-binding domain-containing protein n=1 Tax=Roseateles albus TaxID=2987525 RepID=A0ABT5KF66_9BURK|nr:transporter substrate-binding domain-containing protein [Roseateles albus]MDC8771466.1 transporter substrate-binding domain-containing protein [Roseateles albus]
MKFAAAASALALSMLGLWTPAAQACSKPVRVAMMAWPPYFYAGDLGSAVGGDVEIMQVIFKEAGCKLEIGEEVPRKRRLAMFMAGELDMIPGSSDTPERREYAWFSKPYRNETVSFFTLPAKLERYRDVRGFEDVLNRRITLLSLNSGWFGPAYEQYIVRLREAKLSSTFEGFAQGLVMLSKERGELIMADHATLLTEAARLKMDLAPLPHNISHAPVHMMFNKKTVPEADVLLLDAAAERLEARGVLKQIRRNYGMQ